MSEDRPEKYRCPLASVVIPAWNAEKTLGIQLSALVRQTTNVPFEVLISDNGSTDETRSVAKSFSDSLDIRIVDASASRGPAFARNRAVEEVRSEKILFCDADDMVSERWVEAHVAMLEEYPLVTGPILYVSDTSPAELDRWRAARIPTGPRLYLAKAPFAGSGNLSVRREAFRSLGGFDLELQTGEDAHFTIQAQFSGLSLAWAQEATIYHVRRDTLKKALRQYFVYGLHNALVYRKLKHTRMLDRSNWEMARPYLVLLATSYRLLTPRRRSWLYSAVQSAGRLLGSIRYRVWCP